MMAAVLLFLPRMSPRHVQEICEGTGYVAETYHSRYSFTPLYRAIQPPVVYPPPQTYLCLACAWEGIAPLWTHVPLGVDGVGLGECPRCPRCGSFNLFLPSIQKPSDIA